MLLLYCWGKACTVVSGTLNMKEKLYHSWYLPSDSTLILGLAGVLDMPSP